MSSNTNIGNTPVNQGYVQLIHMGETGGIDGTLRALYDGDGTASDLLIASDKVKISTELFIGSKTLTEFVQDTVGAMFSSNTETNITVTYQDGDGTIDLVSSGEVTLTGSETLTNKTLTSPVINTGISGSAILDEDNMASNSATKLSTQQSIKAYVDAEVAGVVDTAPAALNTLNELAAALGDDANFATTTATSLGEKLVKSSNLSDLTNAGTARSNLGLGSVATLSSIAVSNLTASAIQISSESFADNDTTIMTSAAIQDKIQSFGYSTTTGTVTSVSVGTGLDVADASSTPSITLNLTELADMTEGVVSADELILLDGSTLKRKAISEITLSTFSDSGFNHGAITALNNATANELVTVGSTTTELDAESNLTFDGTDLAIAATGKIYFDGGSHTWISEVSDDLLEIHVGNTRMLKIEEGSDDFVYTPDNIRLAVGNAKDLQISHNATNSYIQNYTGDLYFQNHTTDGDVHFLVDDGGGNDITAIQIDASETGRILLPNDNQLLSIGAGQDLYMFHDGTDSHIRTQTGELYITNVTSDEDIVLRVNDGGSTINAIYIDASEVGSVLLPNDLQKLKFGAGGDGVLYSHEDNFYVSNFTAGKDTIFTNLNSDSSAYVEIMRLDGSATSVNIAQDVKLTATKKLYLDGGSDTYITETSADLVDMYVGAEHALRIADFSNTPYVYVPDNAYLGAGSGIDFSIRHDTSHTYITNSTGDMNFVERDAGNINFRNNSGTSHLFIKTGGNVGIGTSSPSVKLHVNDNDVLIGNNSSGYATLNFHNEGTGSARYASIMKNYDSPFDMRIRASNSTSEAPLVFDGDSNTEYARFDTSGNLGIGTNSPDSYNSAGRNLVVVDSGNSGISIVAGTSSDSSIMFADGTGGTAGYRGAIKYNHGSDYMHFNTAAAERMRLESDGDLHLTADVVAYSSTPSDIRLKENFTKIENGLDVVSKLEGHTFNWKKGGDRLSAGFKAQEVEKVLPHLVDEKKLPLKADDDKKYKILRYEEMIPYLVEAIKEQQKQIEELKNG